MAVRKTYRQVRLTPIQQTVNKIRGPTSHEKQKEIDAEIARLHKIRKYFQKRSLSEGMEINRARIEKTMSDSVYKTLRKILDNQNSEFGKKFVNIFKKNKVTPGDVYEAMHLLEHRVMRKEEYEKWVKLLDIKDTD